MKRNQKPDSRRNPSAGVNQRPEGEWTEAMSKQLKFVESDSGRGACGRPGASLQLRSGRTPALIRPVELKCRHSCSVAGAGPLHFRLAPGRTRHFRH